MINPNDLDRHLTGNWGEDSIPEEDTMGGAWIVEKTDRGYAVIDEDGTKCITLPTKEEAEQWLAFQQEFAETMALNQDEEA